MVTQTKLKAFYETDLKPKLLFFEEQRKLLVSKHKFLWIIFWILAVLAILAIIIVFNLDSKTITIFGGDDVRKTRTIVVFAIIAYLIAIVTTIGIFYNENFLSDSFQNGSGWPFGCVD